MAEKVELSKESLTNIVSSIKEMDAAISAASGQGANAKKAIRERISADAKAEVDALFEKLMKSFEKVDDKVLVGVLGRISEVTDPLKVRAEAVVETEQKQAVPEGAQDTTALREKRKAALDQFKAIYTLLEMAGFDLSDVEQPTARRGGGGGGGTKKSKKGAFIYSIDDKDLSDSQQSFSSMAWYALGGKNAKELVGDLGHSGYLKKLLTDVSIDPKGEFEYKLELVDGDKTVTKLLRARKGAETTEVEAEAATADASE